MEVEKSNLAEMLEEDESAPERKAKPGWRRRKAEKFRRLLREVKERVLAEVEEGVETGLFEGEARIRSRVRALVEDELLLRRIRNLDEADLQALEDAVFAELTGTGPLAPLFADPNVSDILINGPDEVWVDRDGQLERTGICFDDEAHLVHVLGRMVERHGRHLEESTPYVDARLPDGSRLHAMIPPLTEIGPVAAIRRTREVPLTLDEIVEGGTLHGRMAEFLELAVQRRLNVLFCGGASTGKTTLLNIFLGFIPPHERIITIEETRELKPSHKHCIALETRIANTEGRGEVNLRTLVRNALRLRADRIVVGEVRGEEVFDMLQAMNVGHDGSLTTVHANNPDDAMRRLETLVLIGGYDLPSRAIRELLGAAFNLVVFTRRYPDGRRRITSITEVGRAGEGNALNELFRFDQAKEVFEAVAVPRHLERAKLTPEELDYFFGNWQSSHTEAIDPA